MAKALSTTLSYQDDKSDKVYIVFMEPFNSDWIVNYKNGKRGGTMAEGTKTEDPLTYEDAKAVYEKVIKEKTKKGYKIEAVPEPVKAKLDPRANQKGKEFALHYHLSNNGDGSASACFHATAKEAEKADEEMNEDGEGWGEPCSGKVTIKIVDGKLYFEEYDDNCKKVWKPLQEV